MCKDKDENLVGLVDKRGMNLVKNYDIQAHYENDQVKEHLEYLKRAKKGVVAIPEGSAVVISGNDYTVIGRKPVTVITLKEITKYKPGRKIKL